MSGEIEIKRGPAEEVDLKDDQEFRLMVFKHYEDDEANLAKKEGEKVWDQPIDLRTTNPQAYDLIAYWEKSDEPIPPQISAALGHKRPVLLKHVLTPFPGDGQFPKNVWALGYEFIPHGNMLNTISVVPNDEIVKIIDITQRASLGVKLSGEIGVPEKALELIDKVPGLSLTNAKLNASTDHNYQFSLSLSLSFRKVIGGPVGTGGAVWKMYRQDERIDGSHALYQTVLLDEDVSEIGCTVKTWAKQGGWLGSSFGAELWRYDDVEFMIPLR